ncbi:MAG: metalloprotease [Faecalibacterium sp.]
MKRRVRIGPLEFQDPLLLCGLLYLLLWFDAGGWLRLGLLAAFLHEAGHIMVYCALCRRFPVIEITMTGFCMRTRGAALTVPQTLVLAAAGPAMNALLAAVWAAKLSFHATVRASAFLTANLLTGAFNLLPVPPLDGFQILSCVWTLCSAARGRSPSARERANQCRHLPPNQPTLPPIAQAMGAIKSFSVPFFKKEQNPRPQNRNCNSPGNGVQ